MSSRPLGERHLKLQLHAWGAEGSLEAVAFNAHDAAWPVEGEKPRLAVNDYGGRSAPRLVVEHAEGC